jgi:two-component system chemotaxis response regulator CheB
VIRVLVAEDSVTVRELLVELMQRDPQIQVVAQAKNGAEAVDLAVRFRPDLITMDVHMPLMDGFEATKEIMARAPTPIIILSSSISGRDVEMSLNTLRAGALMLIPKPDDPSSADFDSRQGELLTMIKVLSEVKVVRRWTLRTSRKTPVPALEPPRKPSARTRLVAIASSTGGPVALQRILGELPGDFPIPILVVQHIAAGFVSGLAEWLNASCALRVKVAQHGEEAGKRTVFLAPDDSHLGIGADGRLIVTSDPAIAGFRPSATYLFESVARAYGSAAAAVILTGMGSDGVAGLRAIRHAGGHVVAQDEASCVVYGMPREAVAAGVVDTVLPLAEMTSWLTTMTAGLRA